jgi:solute carrier family 25 phosphate transporter 23/24/25/41
MTSQQQHPLVSKLLAGGGASIVSKTCVAPFERTKLLLQTQSLSEAKAKANPSSPLRIISNTVQTQGILSMWRGNFANCVRVFPTYALRFVFFDAYQKLASKGSSPDKPLPMWRQLVAGGLSGATTLTLTYPLDLLRTRLATNSSGARPNIISTILNTYNGEGIGGFYKGYIISLIEISPYLAFSMGGYNWLKERFELPKGTSNTHWYHLLVGWASGTTASLVCYPMDTIKRRMMLAGSVDHSINQSLLSSTSQQGIASTVRGVLRNSGLRGLYAGCIVNALNSGPAAAITFSTNDFLREFLRDTVL